MGLLLVVLEQSGINTNKVRRGVIYCNFESPTMCEIGNVLYISN